MHHALRVFDAKAGVPDIDAFHVFGDSYWPQDNSTRTRILSGESIYEGASHFFGLPVPILLLILIVRKIRIRIKNG
jgi:hypothetical protein